MARSLTKSLIGSASNDSGNVLGLADTWMQEAGSSYHGKTSKHPTNFQVASLNVGTSKRRSSEVVEILTKESRHLFCSGAQMVRRTGGQPDPCKSS